MSKHYVQVSMLIAGAQECAQLAPQFQGLAAKMAEKRHDRELQKTVAPLLAGAGVAYQSYFPAVAAHWMRLSHGQPRQLCAAWSLFAQGDAAFMLCDLLALLAQNPKWQAVRRFAAPMMAKQQNIALVFFPLLTREG